MTDRYEREHVLELLHEHTRSESLRRHAYAVEAAMVAAAVRTGNDPEIWGAVGLLGLAAAVFGLPVLRRALVTSWAMRLMGKVLPRMSETEREALEAGTVWWDAELFSGRPDWDKLIGFHCAGLSEHDVRAHGS